jgi:hypothetical protein
MKTIFDLIQIDKIQFNYFMQLDAADKMFYLLDVYEMHIINKTKAIDLTSFFQEVHQSIDSEASISRTGFPDNVDRVDVMIDEENAVRAENWVKEAMNEGAQLICGGERKGNYFSPTMARS